MILLTATTDSISLTRSSTADVDVVASYMDYTQVATPVVQGDTAGRQLATYNTAATADIVSPPAASETRNVKEITIRNRHATTSNDVTVNFDANGTLYELVKVTLLAGETLEYKDGVGWFVFKPTRGIDVKLRVTADYVNATTSFGDVTGLTYPVEASKHYNFEAHMFHFANATTSGPRFAINGPAMTAMRLGAIITESGGVAAAVMNGNVGDVTALDTAVAATTDSTTSMVLSIISGWFNPSAAGTFAFRACSEVAVAAGITIKQGSWLRLWEAAA